MEPASKREVQPANEVRQFLLAHPQAVKDRFQDVHDLLVFGLSEVDKDIFVVSGPSAQSALPGGAGCGGAVCCRRHVVPGRQFWGAVACGGVRRRWRRRGFLSWHGCFWRGILLWRATFLFLDHPV